MAWWYGGLIAAQKQDSPSPVAEREPLRTLEGGVQIDREGSFKKVVTPKV